jgi:hypothetical protein
VAQISRKRARELRDKDFRRQMSDRFDRLGDSLEGKGRTILYGLGALIALGALFAAYNYWSGRRTEDANRVLGRAIQTSTADITPSPSPGTTEPTFPNERARAESAVREFQAVVSNYGDPQREIARYFIAVNNLVLDRPRGISELQTLTGSSNSEVAAMSKFALAQAREADNQLDEAANIYRELSGQTNGVIPPDTANVRLAAVLEKQGKRAEAADILFRIVESARRAASGDAQSPALTSSVRDAAQRLQTLDPARYAQLPPEPAAARNPLL